MLHYVWKITTLLFYLLYEKIYYYVATNVIQKERWILNSKITMVLMSLINNIKWFYIL